MYAVEFNNEAYSVYDLKRLRCSNIGALASIWI